tara:strand:- start:2406 stop:3080 length:675 start_codon:yes stop_codon:yes gene_type:complete
VIEFISESNLPTRWGEFRIRAYHDYETHTDPVVMMVGDVTGGKDILTRIHDQCLTSEVFGSLRCDCREQLEKSMVEIQKEGRGCIIYLHQEGRGVGLANKIASYALQDSGYDTVDANRELGFLDDYRDYSSAEKILSDIGVKSIVLMTNNPRKFKHLRSLNVEISKRVPLVVEKNSHNGPYLDTKQEKMGHVYGSDSDSFNDDPSLAIYREWGELMGEGVWELG